MTKAYEPSDLLPEKLEQDKPARWYSKRYTYKNCELCDRRFTSLHENWLNPILVTLFTNTRGNVCMACGIDILNKTQALADRYAKEYKQKKD